MTPLITTTPAEQSRANKMAESLGVKNVDVEVVEP
jgi:hypothetical protein